jgi:5-methylcytosine-specific restriction endonuclease McrA
LPGGNEAELTVPKRFCLDCRTLIDVGTGSRCPTCQAGLDQRRDQARGTTKQRGLGGSHRRTAEKIVQAAQVCQQCGQPPTPDNPLTAHHTTARAKGGDHTTPMIALCRRCNSSIGDRTE